MANIKSAKKRVLQDAKARSANNSARSMVRTYIKKAFAVIEAGDRDAAVKAVNEAQSVIGRVAHKSNPSQGRLTPAGQNRRCLQGKVRRAGSCLSPKDFLLEYRITASGIFLPVSYPFHAPPPFRTAILSSPAGSLKAKFCPQS